jgi:hypothetical protein
VCLSIISPSFSLSLSFRISLFYYLLSLYILCEGLLALLRLCCSGRYHNR